MNKLLFAYIASFLLLLAPTFGQETADSTALLGDNFSLQGALELLKNATSPEDFEQKINNEDSYINNLDLNEDGEVDYIRVMDESENDVHVLVLQAVLGEDEFQDVAAIEIEKTDDETAMLQIVGDEDLYGESLIVEPTQAEEKEVGSGGPSADIEIGFVVVNVWLWPSVRFIYAPRYVVWRSPYVWGVYPRAWRPWRPHPLVWHRRHCAVYHRHHRIVRVHRVVKAHQVYKPHRRSSHRVHRGRVNRVSSQKTTVVRNKNGKVVGAKRTTTHRTVVRNRNGKPVAGKKVTRSKTVRKNKRGRTVTTKKTKKVKRRRRH